MIERNLYQREDCHKALIAHFLGDTWQFILERKLTSVKIVADGFSFLQPLDDIKSFLLKTVPTSVRTVTEPFRQ